MPNLACGRFPSQCVCALMQVLLLPVGRSIAGPELGRDDRWACPRLV